MKDAKDEKSLPRQIYDIFASLELAITLFTSVGLLAALGTLIIQNEPPGEYIQKYGETLGGLLLALGFDDLFHSIFFEFLLILFAINLILGTIKRPINKYFLGFYMTHLSLIIVLAGGLVGSLWGDKGMAEIAKGSSSGTYTSRHTRAEVPLPFVINLDDFKVSYKSPEARLYVFEEGDEKPDSYAVLKEGKKTALPKMFGSGLPPVYCEKISYKQLSGESENMEPTYEGTVELKVGGQSVALSYPHKNRQKVGRYTLIATLEPIIGAYKSSVTLTEGGKTAAKAELKVNSPFYHKGYRLYQSSYKKDAQGRYAVSGIEIVKDPGLEIAFFGFGLMIVGVLYVFYVKPWLIRRSKERGRQ